MVPKGPEMVPQEVPCRLCWQCKLNRRNDYIGRCLCEVATSDWVYIVRLSYRDGWVEPEDVRNVNLDAHGSVWVTPRHAQNFFRALRDRHLKVRYFCVGEYGSLKGRAHFHAILFGCGRNPDWVVDENIHIDEWPHGHVYFQRLAEQHQIAYVVKYLFKDTELKQKWFVLSKKPPLGSVFFAEKARYLASQGVWPSSFAYLPPGADEASGDTQYKGGKVVKGKRKAYMMSGASRRDFMIELLRAHGVEPEDAIAGRNEHVARWITVVDKYLREKRMAPVDWAEAFKGLLRPRVFDLRQDEPVDDVRAARRSRADKNFLTARRMIATEYLEELDAGCEVHYYD